MQEMKNHSDMSKNFIPYKQALELKELGFAERCIAYYSADKQQLSLIQGYNSLMFADYVHISNTIKAIPAPLWQQAFDWFLEKHNLYGYFTYSFNYKKYFLEIIGEGDKTLYTTISQFFNDIGEPISTEDEKLVINSLESDLYKAKISLLKKLIELCNKK